MELKIKSTKVMILLFSLLAISYFLFSDKIVSWVSTLHPLLIILVTTILSPVDVIFVWFLYKNYGFRGAIAGFIVSMASSLISLPHILLKNGQFSNDSYSLFPESTIFNMFPQFLRNTNITLPLLGQTNLGVFLIYVGVSIGLVILALMILKKKKFKEVFINSI